MLEVGSCDMAKHIKEIRLRAHVVLRLGYDLIRAGHAAYIGKPTTRRGKLVADLSRRMRKAKKDFKKRLQERYPTLNKPEDEDGVVPPSVMTKMHEIQGRQKFKGNLSHDKHATPAEGAQVFSQAFEGARPSSVVEERVSDAGVDVATQRTEALRQYSELKVNIQSEFIGQLNGMYFSQVFPFTFPYMVGGPEYFSRREDSRRNVKIDALGPYYKHFGVKQLPSCPWVSSGCWTRGVVQRIESQIQADWVTIPALRNVQFRSHVLFLFFLLFFPAIFPPPSKRLLSYGTGSKKLVQNGNVYSTNHNYNRSYDNAGFLLLF